MEPRPHLLTAACGFSERDLLLLTSAGRLSMVRSHSYDILRADEIESPPEIYAVSDSPQGQAQWTALLHRFGNPHALVLGIGDHDQPERLHAFRYRHYRRPILATRLLNALDGLLHGANGPNPAPAPAPSPATPRPPAAAAAPSALDALRGKHVLVVTGNQATSHMLQLRLSALGIAATCAQESESAIRLARGTDYDLALLEPGRIQCPDCFALVRELKQGQPSPLPVILLTDDTSLHARMRGVLNGVDDYLTKPVSPRQLQQALLQHCTPS